MIVDDHNLVRNGLNLLLSTYDELEIVALAETGEQAIELCSQLEPDVVLMDMIMPEVDGPSATKRILKTCPDIKIIALTSFMEDDLVLRAINAGSVGYLLKNVSAPKLVETIKAAHQGQATIDGRAAKILLKASQAPPALGYDLTAREREVLALMVEGKTNKEIAEQLSLSPGTIRAYVSTILSKLGASNRTEAATLALQHNILSAV
jgi:NarL family two-component system response regulator LiaR